MTTFSEAGFDKAKYYTCHEAEVLTYEHPETAIMEEWIDEAISDIVADSTYMSVEEMPNDYLEARLREMCPVQVRAYNPKQVTERQKKAWALNAVETLSESFDDEFSNPEYHQVKVTDEMREKFQQAVNFCVSKWHVWECECIATRDYSYEEILQLTKEDMPEIWEEPSE